MKKLGQILAEKGWLTTAKIQQALQHQQIFGGRLGTCLLELNLLSEERLASALAQQTGLEVARVEDLRTIPEAVLQLVPARMAFKSKVVPFDRYSTEARIAMVNTNDLILQDELAFVTSKRVKVYVAPEIRILEALERHYGCDVDQRYQRIWDRLNRARYLWQEGESSDTAPGIPEAVKRKSPTAELPAMETGGRLGETSPGWTPAPAPTLDQPPAPPVPVQVSSPPGAAAGSVPPTQEILTPVRVPDHAPSEPVAETIPPEPRPMPSAPASTTNGEVSTRPMPSMVTPETIGELQELMLEVEERDHIAHALVLYLSERFNRVLCFMVRGGEVAGWMGTGRDVDEVKLEQFRLDFEEPSLFLNVKAGVPIYRGPLPRMDSHEGLAEIWGGRYPKECVLIPVYLKGRLVTIIYLDKGGRSLGAIDIGELQQIGRMAGRAFENFLVRRKKGRSS